MKNRLKLTSRNLIITLIPPKFFADSIKFYAQGVVNRNGLDALMNYKIEEMWDIYEENYVKKDEISI